MTRLKLKAAVIAAICYLTAQPAILLGEGFIDPGFENYALNSGGFVMPNSGNWTFGNDAGVVEPYSPNSSTGLLYTWSATFAAIEGQQYASTYAGADQIRQGVSLSTAGDYRISVYAAASEGTVAIRPGDTPLALQDGEFTFTLAGAPIGDLNTVVEGSPWNLYEANFTIEKPGVYQLGILNTKTAPYFINYDSFSLQPVPEPATLAMLVMGGVGLFVSRWRRKRIAYFRALFLVAIAAIGGIAKADVFDMPVGLKSLDMATVGDPGNAAFSDGNSQPWMPASVGAVSYIYDIGKYEVTAAQYTVFLNAVAKTDTYGLWDSYMAESYGCHILRAGASGAYTYSVASDWANRPVTDVSFWDACRFCNWLQNNQPSGLQNNATTERGAYTLNGYNGTDGHSIARNSAAKWFLPNDNEWFKAAYYKGGGTNAGYWQFPTKSDTIPVGELPPGRTEPPGSANYEVGPGYLDNYYHSTEVGAYKFSPGPYGTFDQGGNVSELDEQCPINLPSISSNRVFRGGDFASGGGNLYPGTSVGGDRPPNVGSYSMGFRVAGVPEPSTIALLLTAALGGLLWRRRRN